MPLQDTLAAMENRCLPAVAFGRPLHSPDPPTTPLRRTKSTIDVRRTPELNILVQELLSPCTPTQPPKSSQPDADAIASLQKQLIAKQDEINELRKQLDAMTRQLADETTLKRTLQLPRRKRHGRATNQTRSVLAAVDTNALPNPARKTKRLAELKTQDNWSESEESCGF